MERAQRTTSTEPIGSPQQRASGIPTVAKTAGTKNEGNRATLDKRLVVGLVLFVGVLAFFLLKTRIPSVLDKFSKVDAPVTAGNQVAFGQVLDPDAMPAGLRWFAYGVNLWDGNAIGMFFAVLLGGAAVTTFSFAPVARLRRLLGRKGRAGAGIGGAMGMPLFMCSACSAPVSLGFYRAGAGMETSLGVIVGSALFQPVTIVAVFLLMPLPMAVARVVFGLGLLLVIVPLVARLHERRSPAVACEPLTECFLPVGAGAGGAVSPISWRAATGETFAAFGRNTVDFAFRFGPPMLLASLAVGFVFNVFSPERLAQMTGSTLALIIGFAAVGTLLQVPGMFEVPLALGILALGIGRGPATALLLTLPSVGIVTLGITRRDFGWRVPSYLLLATFVGGTAAGITVAAL